MDIEKTVQEILVDYLCLKLEQITLNSRLMEDLGTDSLDVVELLMKFEETFGIEIADEDAERIKTVSDVVNYLKQKTRKKI